jgi:hypothetical protein
MNSGWTTNNDAEIWGLVTKIHEMGKKREGGLDEPALGG